MLVFVQNTKYYNFITRPLMLSKRQSHHSPSHSNFSIVQDPQGAESRLKNKQQIAALIHRFNEVNRQVEIQSDLNAFNLISYERENEKIKYDPQMMTAKLRKLENRAEINRAERQIQHREKKKMRKMHSIRATQDVNDSYQKIYKDFLANNTNCQELDEASDEESVENKNNAEGIAFASQLKRHPLLLEYTLNRMNTNKKIEQEKQQKFQSTLIKFRNNGATSENYLQAEAEYMKKNSTVSELNPESIVQSRFSKFYTKKSTQKLSKQVTSMPRCSKMIQKQNSIVQMQQKSLSKQNQHKLRSRLNQIVLSISKSQRVRSSVLPKIMTSAREQKKSARIAIS